MSQQSSPGADSTEPVLDDGLVSSVRSELPGHIRSRVLVLLAEVLPAIPGLSPALRKVAGFTPGRRAKLGSATLNEALSDTDFLDRAAIQLKATRAGQVHEIAAGPGAAGEWTSTHRLEAAALAWIIADAQAEAWAETGPGTASADTGETQALREQIGLLERQLRSVSKDVRAEQRAKLQTARDENADLRRKLGETRAELRAQRDATGAAIEDAVRAREAAERAKDLADTELRRARSRIEELERQSANARSEDRVGREDESVRARLLLDTLMDAASGLRRELALPPLTHRPADRVAEAIEASAPQPDSGGLGVTTAARLEQQLAVSGVHLILDGYNVTRSVWESTSLETQRTRLLALLPALAARTNAEVTVVFDAAAVGARPSVAAPRGVRVLFSPPQVIADDVIRDLVAAEPTGRPVLVVTADAAVMRDVRADGALTVTPSAMLHLLARDLR